MDNDKKPLIKKIFSKYTQNLYEVYIDDIELDYKKNNIEFVYINMQNHQLVKNLRGERYVKQFIKHIDMNDIGIYALVNNKPVGYGWLKKKGSKDYFYKIENIDYLCRFFVKPEYRGQGIYPKIIHQLMLISKEKFCSKQFYISVEHTNQASINGIKKVGFKLVRQIKFIRCMKITLNKFKLNI